VIERCMNFGIEIEFNTCKKVVAKSDFEKAISIK
jgi:hypothetical protein